jgi:outer membrane protein OmpA-like peptidoglycan-associated protein
MAFGIRLTGIGVLLSVGASGCVATHQWTQDLFTKRQAEVDQRFLKVEDGVREQGERIDRVEVRVADLGTGLTETQNLLNDVLPQKTSTVVARNVARSVPPPDPIPAATVPAVGRTLVGVVNVPFAFDRADLDASAEAALTVIVKEVHESPQVTLDLEGTTDPVGRLDYNLKLSQRRVEVVKRWLVDKGVAPSRIVAATARGPLADAAVKNDLKRRVMVKLMRSTD